MTGDETGDQERGLKPEAGIRFLRGKNSRKERKGETDRWTCVVESIEDSRGD